MLQHWAFHYLKCSTCLCASTVKAHQAPALPTVCVLPVQVPFSHHWSLFPWSACLQHACLHRILKWFGLDGSWRSFNSSKGWERSWSFKEYGWGYIEYFPDPLWTKANLAVGEVGVMLLCLLWRMFWERRKHCSPAELFWHWRIHLLFLCFPE